MSYTTTFSNSKAWVFQSCRKRYAYKYALGIKPLARDANLESWTRLLKGVLIHAGLEGILHGKTAEEFVAAAANEERAKGLRQEQLDALAVFEHECIQIAINFADWLPLSDWELVEHNGVPMSEYEVRTPLDNGAGDFLGYVDVVLRHKATGRVVVFDFKTKASFGQDGDEDYNAQLPLYIEALRRLGILDAPMFALAEIKSSMPKRKTRKVRIDNQSIDTVRESTDGCFRYVPKPVTHAYLANVWKNFESMTLSMSKFSPQWGYVNRSPFQCRGCEYRLLCDAELHNTDVRFIAQNNYKTSPQSLRILTGE